MWKKVLDPLVLCDDEYLLVIDTDVLITRPIGFSSAGPRFVYQCDDVPAYRGSWRLPLRRPMMYSLNAGFMILPPAEVDLDQLEEVTRRYFLNARNTWWTEQSAWSFIMASSGDGGMFDGHDVRTFSGNRKRTPEEVRSNRVKFFGSSDLIDSREEAMELIRGAAVLHFAGSGKTWIDLAKELVDDHAQRQVLGVIPARPAGPVQRLVLSGRLLLKQCRDRFR
jgi:hypothetical protein